MKPFVRHEQEKPSFIDRLLSRQPRGNAIILIESLLASKEIHDVTVEEIQSIAAEHKIDVRKDLKADSCTLYSKYLSFCLEDKRLSEKEINGLGRLRELLQLSSYDTDNIHKTATKAIYESGIDEVLADHRLEEAEVEFLDQLKCDLRIDETFAQDIWKTKVFSLLDSYAKTATEDERLSPGEEEELQAICKSLRIEYHVEEETQKLLDKYRLYWQIENGEIPEIPVLIKIQKSEQCYFHVECNWLEQRRVTKRINYSGPTMRIKIAKGLYWRMGSLAIQPVTEESWRQIDTGELYLTNKRLIFMGGRGNKTIRLSRILDFTPYGNGIDIQKDTGKSPFLEFADNVDLLAMILGRAISEA